MSAFVTGDPVQAEVVRVIQQLQRGIVSAALEGQLVDVKEEAGRRGAHGVVLPGQATSEKAAAQLARELACMANSVTGGAILIGVADDGTPIGTELEADWLRGRVLELTQHTLLPVVEEHHIKGTRCLVARTGPSMERVTINNKLVMRVDDDCVEVPASAWADRQRDIGITDWSALPTDATITDVPDDALRAVRTLLRRTGEQRAAALADADDADMLRRLGVLEDDGHLNAAGALLLTPLRLPPVEFVVRKVAGGDAIHRVRGTHTSLIEQLSQIELTLQAVVEDMPGPPGLAAATRPRLPVRARREAIVNAIAHRDWGPADPIFIEMIGQTMTVTSPGQLPGDITPDNIISHTSVRRNPRLGEVLERLRLAEREAIGVDRMYSDMLADGHPAPRITEDAGRVVVTLNGDLVSTDWVAMVSDLDPPERRGDVNSLLLADRIRTHRWIDVDTAAWTIQRTAEEAQTALANLEGTVRATDGAALVTAHALPRGVRVWTQGEALATVIPALEAADREGIIAGYADANGSVTSTIAMAITDVTRPTANADLMRLEAEGRLEARGAGPTAHYVPIDPR